MLPRFVAPAALLAGTLLACLSSSERVPGNCTIEASSYSQTCAVDSDCVAVGQGNVCTGACSIACASAAINQGAYAQYQADVARLAVAPAGDCNCPAEYGACCEQGICHADSTCSSGDH
jgi:hypothetical protein